MELHTLVYREKNGVRQGKYWSKVRKKMEL